MRGSVPTNHLRLHVLDVVDLDRNRLTVIDATLAEKDREIEVLKSVQDE